MSLHEAVIKAVEPFSVSGGTGAAFVGTNINAETIGWVEDFIPKSSGPNYIPHVTLGIAKQDFANQLKAAPFTQFTFFARRSRRLPPRRLRHRRQEALAVSSQVAACTIIDATANDQFWFFAL